MTADVQRSDVQAPPSDWTEDDVRAYAERIDERTAEAWEEYETAVRKKIADPLAAAWERAADAYERHLAAAELSREGPSDEDRWKRIVAFREATRADVLTPVKRVLVRRSPGARIGEWAARIPDSVASVASEAPLRCMLPSPDALFAPADGDGFVLGLRKRRELARRRRKRMPAEGQTREVPLWALGRRHAAIRLTDAVGHAHGMYQEHVATVAGRLEAALTDWTHCVLEAEHVQTRLDFLQGPLPASVPEDPDRPAHSAPDPAIMQRLVACAGKLQDILRRSAEEIAVLPDVSAHERQRAAADGFRDEVAKAGTFLQPALDESDTFERPPDVERDRWAARHAETVERLERCMQLVALRGKMLRVHGTMIRGTLAATVTPLWQSFNALAKALGEAERRADAAFEGAVDPSATVASLRALEESTLHVLRESTGELPSMLRADAALARPGEDASSQLREAMDALPERVAFRARLRAGKVMHFAPGVWNMRQEVGEVAAPSVERLAKDAAPLRTKLSRAFAAIDQVVHIVEFNLEAALKELEGAGDAGDARELATSGLKNAAATLLDLARSPWPAWHRFARGFFDEFTATWQRVHAIFRSEGEIEDWYGRLWQRLRRRIGWLDRTAKGELGRYLTKGGHLFRRGRQQARSLIEQGRSVIRAMEERDRDRLDAIDAISPAGIRALHRGLPPVYRRLFAFEPLAASYLLEGRAEEIKRIRNHHRRWKRGSAAGALVLPMTPGSGRTSLLNALSTVFESDADVRRITLDARVVGTSAFAALAAEALDADAGTEPSLDRLETALRDASPKVCMVDNLEHLLLRTPGGSDLMERVLIFLSRTDAKVCWICTIGSLAWRFLETALGTATALVTALYPRRLESSTLAEIVRNRHRRSGLPLEFVRPDKLSPLVKRRLRRLRTREAQQDMLQAMYFDRLYRSCGENVMLALFCWLRSVELNERRDGLTVRPLRPLSFGFFDSFDLARAFTLKDLLLHHSLTLREHGRIFRMTEAESIFQLEGLLNLGLILPDVESDGLKRIVAGVRYRLHPLVLHPTYLLLRERNIVPAG